MRTLKYTSRKIAEDIDLNMVPIMNMFLVLIPFLLMSASFLHLKAINTSLPVLAGTNNSLARKQSTKITAIVQITTNKLLLSANCHALEHDELAAWQHQITKTDTADYHYQEMTAWLQRIKEKYPASDTIIIIPEEKILYDTIIQAMDAARYSIDETSLFPNVVLSGKIG